VLWRGTVDDGVLLAVCRGAVDDGVNSHRTSIRSGAYWLLREAQSQPLTGIPPVGRANIESTSAQVGFSAGRALA